MVDTKTTWDELMEQMLKRDRIDYDLDSPGWYWTKVEWNRLRVDKAMVEASIRRLGRVVVQEEYPSCIVENWWL